MPRGHRGTPSASGRIGTAGTPILSRARRAQYRTVANSRWRSSTAAATREASTVNSVDVETSENISTNADMGKDDRDPALPTAPGSRANLLLRRSADGNAMTEVCERKANSTALPAFMHKGNQRTANIPVGAVCGTMAEVVAKLYDERRRRFNQNPNRALHPTRSAATNGANRPMTGIERRSAATYSPKDVNVRSRCAHATLILRMRKRGA